MQSFPFDSKLTYDEHNNPIYDRAVSSQPLRKLIRELFTTGVMPNPSTNLQVSAGSDGMTVQIAAGFAVIDGGLCRETETRTLEVTAADNTYDRIDTVVLRWNENVDVRTADLYVVAGTPAVNPVRPTLQRNNTIYEIGLADVFITKRIATITDDKITDTRYEAERCGVVRSISEYDTTYIYQQVQADLASFKSNEQAEFTTWFKSIRDILDENVAAHLQSEIDNLDGRLGTFEDPIENYTNGLGNTSIKNVGDGTVTGVISQLHNDLTKKALVNTYYDDSVNKLYLVNADGTKGSEIKMGKQLFPNLSSKIATLSGHSYTATKDCFLMGVPFVSGGDIGTFINDNVALKAQQNCCVFLKAGDKVTAGLSNQPNTWVTDGVYYNNPLAVFDVLER